MSERVTAAELERDVVAHLAEFPGNAGDPVLSFVDDDGFPVNVRCAVAWAGGLRFRLTISPDVLPRIRDGARACLLWHRHDEVLFELASIILRGSLGRDDGPYLDVDRTPIISGIGEADWVEALRVFAENHANYLRKYELAEPDVNWPLLEKLAAEAVERYGDPAA